MKKLGVFIVKLITLVLLLLLFLDYIYTWVYSHSINRNKIELVVNTKDKYYDVIALGSSRANNHFDMRKFEALGLKAYNYGMSGARLQESALLLELMINNKFRIKNVLIEIDLNINSEGYSEGTRARFMPFINTSKIISNYYAQKINSFDEYKYIPFYRYIKYQPQIGFREMVLSAIHKPSDIFKNSGFNGLTGSQKELSYNMINFEPKPNKDYERIKYLCKLHKINLIAVTTPICKNSNNFDYFKKIKNIYPEVHNYETVVQEDRYFESCGHMNIEGAMLFTDKIIEDFFK